MTLNSPLRAQDSPSPEGYGLSGGQVAPSDSYCFTGENIGLLGGVFAECGVVKRQLGECEIKLEEMAADGPTPWHDNPWFYISIGVAAGFGGALLIQSF